MLEEPQKRATPIHMNRGLSDPRQRADAIFIFRAEYSIVNIHYKDDPSTSTPRASAFAFHSPSTPTTTVYIQAGHRVPTHHNRQNEQPKRLNEINLANRQNPMGHSPQNPQPRQRLPRRPNPARSRTRKNRQTPPSPRLAITPLDPNPRQYPTSHTPTLASLHQYPLPPNNSIYILLPSVSILRLPPITLDARIGASIWLS